MRLGVLPWPAHLEPEVLLVDEVLAVGDAAFQKKMPGQKWGGCRSRWAPPFLFVQPPDEPYPAPMADV